MNDSEWVREAFLTVLASEPTPEELVISVEALKQFQQLATTPTRSLPLDSARVQFILALVNHNDFVTVR